MSLRPRYSLLALLLLTAAVAVGVKLWRGPYRVQFSYSETDIWLTQREPNQLWHELGLWRMPLKMQGKDVQQECEYLQGPQGKHVLTVSETWDVPRYLVLIEKPGHAVIPQIWRSETPLTPESVLPLDQQADFRIVSVERVVCWVATDLTHYLGGVLNGQRSNELFIRVGIPANQAYPCYFLTAEGQVYQLRTPPNEQTSRIEAEHTLEAVEWSSITNAAIKARLQEYLSEFKSN